jgi:hypothetical protein
MRKVYIRKRLLALTMTLDATIPVELVDPLPKFNCPLLKTLTCISSGIVIHLTSINSARIHTTFKPPMIKIPATNGRDEVAPCVYAKKKHEALWIL